MERDCEKVYINCFFYGFIMNRSLLRLYKEDITRRIFSKIEPREKEKSNRHVKSFKSMPYDLNEMEVENETTEKKKIVKSK
jgi:uncharacterized Fe-S cluster-containing MiaB family protein